MPTSNVYTYDVYVQYIWLWTHTHTNTDAHIISSITMYVVHMQIFNILYM